LIRVRHRGAGLPQRAFSPADLVETKPLAPLLTLTRTQETDLPATARIAFSSADADYRQAIASSRRLTGASGRIADAQLPLVMGQADAARIADTWLFEAWASREKAHLEIPPSALALEAGDVIEVANSGKTRLLRVTGIGDHGSRALDALSIDPVIYSTAPAVARPAPVPPLPSEGPVLGLFLDLPLLTGNENPLAGYVAAARSPWPGEAAFYRSPETTGYVLAALATRNATTGATLDPLPPGPESRIDHATHLHVKLDTGSLASVTHLGLLGGANAAAIEAADGKWEVLQFETATLVAPATYLLTGLLRGQAGTEDAMRGPVPSGARVILLDQAITPVPLSHADIDIPFNWRYGPSTRDLGDETYQTARHSFSGRGLRPLSPVHVRGSRTNGDLVVTWLRRTRIGGDNWLPPEVPLGEDAEAYEIDILSGTTVVRTLTANTPSITYTAAQQIEDFGAPQPSLTVRIVQMSFTIGRGIARSATL
ncbi:MAG: phage tail protein, partial [Hyphomicrobiaceae bacterium]